jgi:DNA-binding NtrC family response regulator
MNAAAAWLALPAALDLCVLIERDDAGFDAPAPLPSWAGEYLSSERPVRLAESFLFLETFLEEAAEHWSRRVPGPLRSGPWSERGADGLERTFEAQALFHAGRRLLVIERLGADFQQLQQSLQLARGAELHKQRVGLLTAALVGRGVAHRPADPGAESILLIEPGGCYRDLGVSSVAAAEAQLLTEWLEPEAAAALTQRLTACVRERRHHAVLCTVDGAEGERHFEARLIPFGDDRALALVRDVTRRMRLQAELERRTETLRGLEENVFRLLDELETGALALDADGRCVFASAAACEALGRGRGDLHDRPWLEILADTPVGRRELASWADRPRQSRGRRRLDLAAGRSLELDLREDPLNPERRLLFVYDVTEVQALRRRVDEGARFGELIGVSSAMRDVYRLIEDFAPMPTTVLIEGETGVGKELAARALHQRSPRAAGPFVAVNCAGLPESLAAGQLFGHRRGSFTGAVRDQRGLFEAANGGTLFLDEIGDLPQMVQTALLRVLQEREVLRIGETTPRKIDVRLLTATHRDLEVEVREGRFRADLYYRIRVARICMPALRERVADIPLLAGQFLQEMAGLTGRPLSGFSPEALRLLAGHSWPGNVRELRSAVEYAAIRTRTSLIAPVDLPAELAAESPPTPEPALPEDDEAGRFRRALERAGGNRTKAARLLGVSRATFYRRLGQLGFDGEQG